jgi:hypothetical protein
MDGLKQYLADTRGKMMAQVEDYVGREFGGFRIGKSIGHGKEAEVLLCQHLMTGRVYVLRLDVEDDETWDDGPMIPPRNGSLERNNCDGTWALSSGTYRRMVEQIKKGDSQFIIHHTPIYGVLDNRYLVPMASPIRVKDAWDIDTVLQTSHADDLLFFELWEDLILSMILGAYEADSPQEEWIRTWNGLIGGPILQRAMTQYLNGGQLTGEQKQRVLINIRHSSIAAPEFAENSLLRLCGCLSRHRMTFEEARATLRCFYFRINVSLHELNQIVAAYNALLSNPLGSENSIKLLEFVLLELTKAPLDQYEHWEQFEIRTEPPDNSRFNLFLQEHAGASQKVLCLERK